MDGAKKIIQNIGKQLIHGTIFGVIKGI